MKTAELTFLICALASICCAFMLVRAYRKEHSRLLLWSCLCFAGLALNNSILFMDLVLLPDVDFSGSLIRAMIGAASGSILLFGLIWELT